MTREGERAVAVVVEVALEYRLMLCERRRARLDDAVRALAAEHALRMRTPTLAKDLTT